MLRTKDVDPELHTLRSAARSIQEPVFRHDAEAARTKLYEAFEARDPDAAKRWAQALRAALVIAERTPAQQLGLDALRKIETAIGSDGTFVYIVEERGEPLWPFFRTSEAAKKMCEGRAGKALKWTEHDAHGQCWVADGFKIGKHVEDEGTKTMKKAEDR